VIERVFRDKVALLILAWVVLTLSGCTNSPYPPYSPAQNTLYIACGSAVGNLDPATAYPANELDVVCNVVEPPFTYEYLKRPYELIPLVAEEVPKAVYLDDQGNLLPKNAPRDRIHRVEYTVRIRKGIKYAPHPCFARGPDGKLLYDHLSSEDLKGIETPMDFTFDLNATREATAEDFVRAFRRQVDPTLLAPLKGIIERVVLGGKELGEDYKRSIDLERERRKRAGGFGYSRVADERVNPIIIDYVVPDCEGIRVIDRYTYKVVLKHPYPQILYWMGMSFMAPMPQEVLDFYNQKPMIDKQILLRYWPVGTGAYYLSIVKPQERIQFRMNPFYRERGEKYPSEGEPGDAEAGLLVDAGKTIPFIDVVEMTMEREAVPLWNKFMQGYYDTPYMSTEVDVNTINMACKGRYDLSDDLKRKGIKMSESVSAGVAGFGFNLKDDVVGGLSEEECKLRQAISIALDYEEYIAIFMHGRGLPAMGPLPPGIFGCETGEAGMNPYTHNWDPKQRKAVRKPIEEARSLLAEAGYPGGRDKNGQPLVLYLDHRSGGRPDFNSEFAWYQKKLARLGIELRQRGTDVNRYWEKRKTGHWQCTFEGWGADYPDPENFFFLWLKPPEGIEDEGVNPSNYERDEYQELYPKMEALENGPERKAVVDRMVELLRHDAPWAWSVHGKGYGLQHEWSYNSKPNQMVLGTLKFKRIDPALRARRVAEWNRPRYWPVVGFFAVVIGGIIPGIVAGHRRERKG
jgi:ABC-type transport system substrate-binding protein